MLNIRLRKRTMQRTGPRVSRAFGDSKADEG